MGVSWDLQRRPVPESRAIDLIPLFRDKEGHIRILGGFRGDTGQACFVGGFQEGDAFKSVVREFFEEAVSGSFDVPEEMLAKYKGDLGEKKAHYLAEHDTATVDAVTEYFRSRLGIVYRGPVLADPSRTDERWVATTAYSGMIEMEDLEKILARSPHQLKISAGSDLKETAFHKMNSDFAINAFASHGPIGCYALVHVLREKAQKGLIRLSDRAVVNTLIGGISSFLTRHTPCRHRPRLPALTA
jgi:hypothetical protein